MNINFKQWKHSAATNGIISHCFDDSIANGACPRCYEDKIAELKGGLDAVSMEGDLVSSEGFYAQGDHRFEV